MFEATLKSLVEKMGYGIVPLWRLPQLAQSEFLKEMFFRYEVDLVLDVGANVGQFRDYLRSHCSYHGRVISYEPNPECVARIEERLPSDPQWSIEPVALGAKAGTLTLNIMRSSSFSSFREPDSTAVPELAELNTVVARHEVSVQRLDAQNLSAASGDLPAKLFVKLDTQGFDLEVLEGATGLLEQVVAVQTEASVLPIYENMPDMRETILTFSNAGFTLANVSPVTRDSGLRAVEFDMVFINNIHAERLIARDLGVV